MRPTRGHTFLRWLPAAVAMLGLALALSALLQRPVAGPYDLQRFAKLPVSADGRVKPVDTVARNTLLSLSGRQTFEADGQRQPAVRFLLDVMAQPEDAASHPVVRIDHPDDLAIIGRPPGEVRRFPLADLESGWRELVRQGTEALDLEPRRRDPFQRAAADLFLKLDRLMAASQMHWPYMVPPLAAGEEWRPFDEVFLESR